MAIKTIDGYTELVINQIKLPDIVIDKIKQYCSFRPHKNKLLYNAVNQWCVNKKKSKREIRKYRKLGYSRNNRHEQSF